MLQNSGLTVRQYEREGVELPFELTVQESHALQVRFSGASAALNATTIRGEATDISGGGMGLRTRSFVPRMTEGIVRVFTPDRQLQFEHKVKVRRVTLIGREPMYSLGVAFVDSTPELDRQIEVLFATIAATSTPAGGNRDA